MIKKSDKIYWKFGLRGVAKCILRRNTWKHREGSKDTFLMKYVFLKISVKFFQDLFCFLSNMIYIYFLKRDNIHQPNFRKLKMILLDKL